MSSSAGANGAPIKSVDLHVGEAVPGVKKVDPIIVADHIKRSFGGLTAVDVEHLEIPRGAITALIGPNGAGKTTLFNLLTGFDKPDTGEWTIRVADEYVDVDNATPAPMDRRIAAAVIDVGIEGVLVALAYAAVLGGLFSGSLSAAAIFGSLFALASLTFLVLQTISTGKNGTTVGKRAMRLKVVSTREPVGQEIGVGRAFLRLIIWRLIASVPVGGLLLVALSPMWDRSKRGLAWHDRVSDSMVVDSTNLTTSVSDHVAVIPLSGRPAYTVSRDGMIRTFQLTKALSLLTVMDNMKLGARGQVGESLSQALIPWFWRKQEAEIEARALELLARFKLDEKKDDYAAGLSGGQRKLLEMARALMSQPTLVMLDEPMAGVNPALTQSLLDHILNLKTEGMTVLFVEHDMHMVRHIADWVVVMAEGKVVAEGDPHEVMANPAVIDAYLGSHHDSDLGDLDTGVMTAIKELADDDADEIKH